MKNVKYIIHLADIHIRTFRLHKEYKNVFTNLINRCKTLTEGYEYGEFRVALVGDLVHQKITISNEQLLLSSWFLTELSKIAPVILIAGNHDLLENNKDRLDSLSPMIQLLNNPNIYYYKESKCYLDNNVVWCNYSIFENNQRPDIESYKKEYGEDKKYIGLFHAPLAGATTDIGYEFDEHHTTLEHFEGCDFVLCGDIHKKQVLYHTETKTINNVETKKVIKIAYCGSLIQQNFGETIKNHGILLWDVNNGKFIDIEIQNDSGFYQYKISSLDDLETNSEKLING